MNSTFEVHPVCVRGVLSATSRVLSISLYCSQLSNANFSHLIVLLIRFVLISLAVFHAAQVIGWRALKATIRTLHWRVLMGLLSHNQPTLIETGSETTLFPSSKTRH